LEQQCFQHAFGLSEQQQPEQQEQQPRLPAGSPLNSAECIATAEQAAFLQKRRAFAKESRAFLLVQRQGALENRKAFLF